MDILLKALGSLWQVVLVGLLLGAGIPTLFAIGVRSLYSGVTVTPEGETVGTVSRGGRIGAVVCFSVLAVAVVFGIIVIVFGKRLFS